MGGRPDQEASAQSVFGVVICGSPLSRMVCFESGPGRTLGAARLLLACHFSEWNKKNRSLLEEVKRTARLSPEIQD